MTLEAVWLKNGKEIYWVDPAWEVSNIDDTDSLHTIRVFNATTGIQQKIVLKSQMIL